MGKSKKKVRMSLETILKAVKDSDWRVRAAAMNACQGKDVPLEVIKEGLSDSDWQVRAAAMKLCEQNGIPLPVIRRIEPPERVYKKCVGGVIVVASIPKDAEVRFCKSSGKCRANKAVIEEIIGDFCGEKVGISIHDRTTEYYVGDKVYVEDFDRSDEECSTGFHFFRTKEEAEAY